MPLFHRLFSVLLVLCVSLNTSKAQHSQHPIAKRVQQHAEPFAKMNKTDLLERTPVQLTYKSTVADEVTEGTFFTLQDESIHALLKQPTDLLAISIPAEGDTVLDLQLFKAEVFTDEFKVYAASNPYEPYPYTPGLYYWGIVNNDAHSLAAITVHQDEIKGLVSYNGHIYNLGKLNEDEDGIHILYKEKDLKLTPQLSCGTDDALHYIGNKVDGFNPGANDNEKDASNCVRMYVEVDYDIFVGKGGVTQAANYVSDVFAQVAILYANESIDFTVNEILVWDVTDPYTGPSTSNYLTQFRDNLNGNYNGDLAHLVGYNGGGGVAYVDVLCNGFYGVGYSDINSTFANVPTYSWTIEVVTHEIGHNLGSRHTHDCVWNGNNTAIDGCGPAAGYGNSCGGGPIPDAGTIMSYCHLVGGVGIDFNLGFGPQPGNLIRNEVYNATCLTACSSPDPDDAGITAINVPTGTICTSSISPEVELFNYGSNDLTSVTIDYQLNGNSAGSYTWTGTLASNSSTTVTLPSISYSLGNHTFGANTTNPNGVADADPSNDGNSSSFNHQGYQTYYADNDGDDYGDDGSWVVDCVQPSGYVLDNTDCDDTNPNINPGAPEICGDGIDNNCDGVSEGTAANTSFQDNPLTHSGTGSSSTLVAFLVGDSDPSFTISGLNAKTNGNPSGRYIERVTVGYVDGNGQNQTYGVFNGDQVSSVNVSISSEVQSVTVILEDGYDGNAPGTLSVDFSSITYCTVTPPCDDDDNDGVCNADDQCPNWNDNWLGTACNDGDDCTTGDIYVDCNLCQGTPVSDSDDDTVCDAIDNCPSDPNPGQEDADGDNVGDVCDNCLVDTNSDQADADADGVGDVCDNCPNTSNPGQVDSDNDGIGDACDNNCTPGNYSFSPNPLVHQGAGSSGSSVTIGGQPEVQFTVNGLGSKTNGNPSGRYIDKVVITYMDGIGSTQNYGTFYGDQQSSVVVDIPGLVQSVTVALSDHYDGDTGNTSIDVNMTTVTSCSGASIVQGGGLSDAPGEVDIYPNPVYQNLFVRFEDSPSEGDITIFNILGRPVAKMPLTELPVYRIDMDALNLAHQTLFVSINVPGQEPIVKRIIHIRE